MSAAESVAVDLYIAVYADPDAARQDWDAVKLLAEDDIITVDGLLLVSRRADGKIHVDDDSHQTRKGTKWGVVGGLVAGLIFPPSLLASAVAGGALGAGVGGLVSHHEKKQIKHEIEDVLPINSSGIVALFEERWAAGVDDALANADTVKKDKVDKASADQVKAAAGVDE